MRIRRTFDLEGVQLAETAESAARIVELGPPLTARPEAAPSGAPLPYGALVTLEARVLVTEGALLAPIQRQARGRGATPAEAEEQARVVAADLLGRRLAEMLQ